MSLVQTLHSPLLTRPLALRQLLQAFDMWELFISGNFYIPTPFAVHVRLVLRWCTSTAQELSNINSKDSYFQSL